MRCSTSRITAPVGEVTTPITQEVDWYAYTKYPAAALNFALDKLTQICLEIDGAKLDEDYLP